jgi:hypothetical protein
VQPPEHDTDHDERDGRAERQQKVRDDQARDSGREQSSPTDPEKRFGEAGKGEDRGNADDLLPRCSPPIQSVAAIPP